MLGMARIAPSDRLEQLIAAAAAAFVEHGFERTQMDDIANRLGVSKGTIYRSVASKEALFAAVLIHADDPAPLSGVGALDPVEWSDLSVLLRDELARRVQSLGLASTVASRTRSTRPFVGDIGEEIAALTRGAYSMMAERRVAVMVLDRCASEIPGITVGWYDHGRYALVDLWARYLDLRREHISTAVEHDVLARTIVEIITLWAVKMPWDPAPRPYPHDLGEACTAMIRALVTGGTP